MEERKGRVGRLRGWKQTPEKIVLWLHNNLFVYANRYTNGRAVVPQLKGKQARTPHGNLPVKYDLFNPAVKVGLRGYDAHLTRSMFNYFRKTIPNKKKKQKQRSKPQYKHSQKTYRLIYSFRKVSG